MIYRHKFINFTVANLVLPAGVSRVVKRVFVANKPKVKVMVRLSCCEELLAVLCVVFAELLIVKGKISQNPL